jgi:hypothetical protein
MTNSEAGADYLRLDRTSAKGHLCTRRSDLSPRKKESRSTELLWTLIKSWNFKLTGAIALIGKVRAGHDFFN